MHTSCVERTVISLQVMSACTIDGAAKSCAVAGCGVCKVNSCTHTAPKRICVNVVCAHTQGLQIRGNSRYANIDKWFEALEKRPSYMATKSDFYTHVTDIPPQVPHRLQCPQQ